MYVKKIYIIFTCAIILINIVWFFQWFTPDGFRSLLALVGTNGQGIGTSAFSRWVKNVSALDLPKDERIYIDKLIDRIYDDMEEGKL